MAYRAPTTPLYGSLIDIVMLAGNGMSS